MHTERKNIKRTKTKAVITLIVLLILVVACIGLDNRLLIRKYSIDTDAISAPVRIALITDLHSCKYGENQQELIEAVIRQDPDLILLGGDIFDDEIADTNAELFLQGIAGKFPCYYVTGNHEYWSGKDNFAAKMAILEKYNIPVLSGTCETLTAGNENINICGVDDPDAYMVAADGDAFTSFAEQLASAETAAQNGYYTILLSHRPEYVETYASYAFDLVLCGHAHGGQWRIPWLLNGVYAPNQGFFPEYAGGMYAQDDMTMIVSRGLARETTRIPRVFNRPELVIIDLQ